MSTVGVLITLDISILPLLSDTIATAAAALIMDYNATWLRRRLLTVPCLHSAIPTDGLCCADNNNIHAAAREQWTTKGPRFFLNYAIYLYLINLWGDPTKPIFNTSDNAVSAIALFPVAASNSFERLSHHLRFFLFKVFYAACSFRRFFCGGGLRTIITSLLTGQI